MTVAVAKERIAIGSNPLHDLVCVQHDLRPGYGQASKYVSADKLAPDDPSEPPECSDRCLFATCSAGPDSTGRVTTLEAAVLICAWRISRPDPVNREKWCRGR